MPLDGRIVVLLLGFGALYSSFSWARDFWAPEEDDFAAVTREMSESGSWFVPTLAGEPYFEKAPLLYWSGLLLGKIPGLPPESAYRLIVMLFGVLGIWVTYVVGLKFYGRWVGIVAAFAQGTTVLYFRCSSWYLTDVLFSSSISLALSSLGIALLWEPKSRRWKVLGFLGLAVACLSKSPLLALYLVFAPLLVFLVLHRRSLAFLHDLRRLRPGLGLALVLILVAPWYVWVVSRYGWDFLSQALLEQHVDRLVNAASHQKPLWYYVTTLPADFLPWTLFLPLGIYYAHAHFRTVGAKFFFCWAVVMFVSLSLVSSKQGKYLLPMWTPMAVLVAAALLETELESIWERFLGRAVFRVASWALLASSAALVVILLLWFVGAFAPILRAVGGGAFQSVSVDGPLESGLFRLKVTILVVIVVGAFIFTSRRIDRAVAADRAFNAMLWFARSTALCFFLVSFLYSDLNTVKSAREFCAEVKSRIADRPLRIYGRPRGSILFYIGRAPGKVGTVAHVDASGKTANPERQLEAYLEGEDEVYLLAIDRDFRRLVGLYPKIEGMVEEVHAGRVGSRRRYLLLRNRRD